MRMEELENQRYIKSTDTVEKFLLNVIQEYFKDSNTALEGSREYIIREAVDRLKTEMDYNSLGVLSITLPNGEVRKGDVNLTLEDLDGEPEISPKRTAFNVDFGDKANTACEGNDPRLSNKRYPLQHNHNISDVADLEGILSTLEGKCDRLNGVNHVHNNKTVLDKLIYTGTKNVIDLGILDTLEDKIDSIVEQLRQHIAEYIEETNEAIDEVNKQLVDIYQQIENIKTYIIEKCEEYLRESQAYTDEKFSISLQELKDYADENYLRKSDVQDIIDIVRNSYTMVGTQRWQLKSLLRKTDGLNRYVTLEFNQSILEELQRRTVNVITNEVFFDLTFEYEQDEIKYVQPLPFMFTNRTRFGPYIYPKAKEETITGYIENIQATNDSIKIYFMNDDNLLTRAYLNGYIVCRLFSKDVVPIFF